MLWLDNKYVALLSSQLRNFRRKSDNLYNFSCPKCGDSKKNKRKARGYFYESEDHLNFKCFNCGAVETFNNFLREMDASLHKEYKMEVFREGKSNNSYVKKEIKEPSNNKLSLGSFIEKAADNEAAFSYLRNRKIPTEKIDGIYYTDDLNKIKGIWKNKQYESTIFKLEPRVVIPYYTMNNSLLGVACRSLLDKTNLRYINLRIDNDEPLVYNLNKVNLANRKFVTEGAFDSMFLDNAIAVSSLDFNKALKYLNKESDILVFDNEPRNEFVVKKMESMVDKGYNVCIWPEVVGTNKDINKMIEKGFDRRILQNIIINNSYNGMVLKLKIASWRKI